MRIRAKNNMVWGETVNWFLPDGPIHVIFDKNGNGTINGSVDVPDVVANHIRQFDPDATQYEIYESENPQETRTMTEQEKKKEESFEDLVNKTVDAKDDRKHGIDPVAKAENEPSKKETHDDRVNSGIEADVRQTAQQEDDEDRNSGVDPEKKMGTRDVRGEGEGKHGIAEKETNSVKIDEEENARSGVDTASRDSSRKLTAKDNEKHGVAGDQPKSSARKILGDDPRDELRNDPNVLLHEDPRRTLKEQKNDILYEDERDNLTSTPLDDPAIGGEAGDESKAKSRKKAK